MAMRAIETANLKVELFPSPIEPTWIIEGNPQAKSCVISRSTDRLSYTVIWECTEGKFNWYYGLDETILILEGSIILESDSLPSKRYASGDTILFRKGAHARWHVEEHVKKLAFCHKVQPALVGFALRSLSPVKNKLSALVQRRSAQLPHGSGAL
jgi:uncharacterized cupin superfamily protein